MTIAKDIILDSLQMIGVHKEQDKATPESIEIGREELNEMMDEWKDDDIELGYIPVEFSTDIVSIPLSAQTAVKANLAVGLAPYFDNGDVIVSPKLKQKAIETFERMKRNNQIVVIPNKQVSGTMPLGAGNARGVDPQTSAGPGFVLSDEEGNLND